MNFSEALQHLKQGSILTLDRQSYFVIKSKSISRYCFYKGRLVYEVAGSFSSSEVLREDWVVLTTEEENLLGIL